MGVESPQFENGDLSAVYAGQHMHWYQPPREAADRQVHGEQAAVRTKFSGLENHERLQSWTDVLTSLSYEPNAEAGNFERMSFNLSPILAQYLEKHHPETYQQVVAAPGNAEATGQPHNVLGTPYFHAIMPLLPEHDQDTLLQWGRVDTERRFGKRPDGVWMPELAVDALSLEVAHRNGYDWTYGFAHQLKGNTGTPTAYDVSVGSGSMKVLRESSHDRPVWDRFYQGDVQAFYEEAERQAVPYTLYPQMFVKAADGEHLQREYDRYGRPKTGVIDRVQTAYNSQTENVHWMLPTTFMSMLKADNVDLPRAELAGTTAGEGTFDDRMARTYGLDRWTGEVNGETTVPWKRELQAAYREFSDNVDVVYETGMNAIGVEDPWGMRNDYIRLLAGEVDERGFFQAWDPGGHINGEEGRQQILKLLASQYHKLAASSSCGWFFDTPSGLEPKIVTRQMRIALEHLRTSNIADIPAGFDVEATTFNPETAAYESETLNAQQLAGAIEDQLLERLHRAADEKTRLSRVYKRLGVNSVRSALVPQ